MYCKHCGKDEPEIKLNDKTFCSVCGLSLDGNDQSTNDTPKNDDTADESEDKKELSSAFSQLGSTLDDKSGGFYRSKDVRVVPRPKKDPKKDKDNDNTEDIVPEPETVEIPEKEEINKPIPSIDEPVDLPITKVTKEDKRIEDEILAKISGVSASKEEATESVEVVHDETPHEEAVLKEDAPKEKATESIGTIKNDKEKVSEVQGNEFRKAVKEVDKLGSASKLLDILEDEASEKELDRKEKKAKKLEGTFGKLIDILNQPVKSPGPVKATKATKKDVHEDQIRKNYEELLSQKELESPLDDLEIEPPEEPVTKPTDNVDTQNILDDKKTGKDETWPIFDDNKSIEAEDKGVEVDDLNELEEKMRVTNEDKINSVEETEKTEIPEEAKEKIEEALKTINDNEGEKDKIESLNLQDEKHITNKEHSEIEKDIHGFGDKKDHIDHWPEEKVKKNDETEIKENHHTVLAAFMKTLVNENPKDKKEEKKKDKKKEKKVKKKPKKKKKRENNKIVQTLLGFLGSIIIIGGALYYFVYLNDTPKAKRNITDISVLITFDAKYPTYIPIGYDKESQTAKSSVKAVIAYSYAANIDNLVTLHEEYMSEDVVDVKTYAEGNSNSYKTTDTLNNIYYELDDNKITWIENDIWFILEKTGDLSSEELMKIAKSI